MSEEERQLHALEEEFGLPAQEILDVINRRNRCKIAVRGAIAEAHLATYLEELKTDGAIDDFQDFDRDAYPDYRIDYQGHAFLLEVKNVRQSRSKNPDLPIRVEVQRSRTQIGNPQGRYYTPDEFAIIAACLWNRTGAWVYRFVATRDLSRHADYPDRLAAMHIVALEDPAPGTERVWDRDLPQLLEKLVSG